MDEFELKAQRTGVNDRLNRFIPCVPVLLGQLERLLPWVAKAAQGQRHGGDQRQLRVAVFNIAAPQRFEVLGLKRCWLDVALV